MNNETFSGIVSCLVLMAIGHWLLRITWSHRATLHFQLRLFAIALVVRFIASIAIYQFGFWSTLGDADAIGWWFGDWQRLQWEANNFNLIDVLRSWGDAFRPGAASEMFGAATHVGYYYLLATVFFVIGTSSRLIAAAINDFAGALVVVFAYRTARTLFSEWVAIRVAWWTCFFPSMIVWSAQTVKEPVVILLEVITLYSCLRLRKSGFSLRYVLLAGCAIALTVPFRFYAAYVGIAAFGVVLFAPRTDQRRTPRWSLVGLVAFAVTVIMVGFVLANTESKFDQFDLDFIQRFRHDIAEGSGSGVDLNLDMHTTGGFSLGTLVGALHLLLAPFPWQLGTGSFRMLLTTPELVYWWWLFFVGVLPGIPEAFRRRSTDLLPVLVFIVGLGMLYSMTFGNIGLIFRQRAQLLPWLLMFAAVGLERRTQRLALKSAREPLRVPPRVILPANARS